MINKPISQQQRTFISQHNGFTFIDLIFTLAILTLLFGFALPSFNQFIDRQKIATQVSQFKYLLQNARKQAILEKSKITVCPTDDQLKCNNNWSDGFMAFIDLNENRQKDKSESMIYVQNLNHPQLSLKFKAFGYRNSFQWHQTGITNHQNGTFLFCWKNKPELARALIISKAGRMRHSQDSNQDGIQEDANDKNLHCK
ncbi:GspH/FimT family pseudopilin [Aliikangiella maris]|uniref:Type II secretion system protein H n=1 Tax=Aliikangiella maris TaxID=3162458 RepID=A0ABV2BQS3_9GAMM